jgi:hypothetical protein
MAISYEVDVAPHMRRAMHYRILREHRWLELHEHDGRPQFWRIAICLSWSFGGLVAHGIHAL